MYAYAGILTALYERERTGTGSTLEVALLDALGEWMTQPVYHAVYGGQPSRRTGARHASIAALPGRRYVFTNGCRDHAARILDRLGMTGLFDAVWDIRTIAFAPKPKAEAYASVVRESGITCAEAAMFDDIARNLVPARALGMTTVWLKTDSPWGKHGPLMDVSPRDIDHETDNLTQFLKTIRI